ncbi:MAG: hypothetical protein ACRCX7_10055 [Cetobacterium sp.]|uniref:hypothetical protein n=1 Tax=Cetobacterium sp. TaxID=2071632 RepID=UPI003F36D937
MKSKLLYLSDVDIEFLLGLLSHEVNDLAELMSDHNAFSKEERNVLIVKHLKADALYNRLKRLEDKNER